MTGTRLQDKIAIVTGSSTGIGRAIALQYAAEGAYVACSDLDPSPKAPDNDLKTTHEEINEKYPGGKFPARSIFVKADASASDDVERLVKECVKQFGRLDIMVNNAGIGYADRSHIGKRIHELDDSSWDKVMGINGKGVWLGCKIAIAQFLAQDPHPSGDRGWIINTGSVHSFVGTVGSAAYCASKGAVGLLTKAVALEYGQDRIHVNAIAPGYIKTPLLTSAMDPNSEDQTIKEKYKVIEARHPFERRMGQADEVAPAAVFLASADAAWVTGHILAVDGGYLAQ